MGRQAKERRYHDRAENKGRGMKETLVEEDTE